MNVTRIADGVEGRGSPEWDTRSEMVTWADSLPNWQRDALRRLCERDALDDSDLNQLLEVCKGERESTPVKACHIRDPAASNAAVCLSRLHNLQNVNAIHSGEALSFNRTGLTVIYGDNGAGKSGYARVLKQACRARRQKGDAVRPNVHDAKSGTPQAEIQFCVGGQDCSFTWVQGAPTDVNLSAISVFDSSTATIHVDGENNLAYTPLPLRITAQLAEACDWIRDRLNREIKEIEQQSPEFLKNCGCAPDTEVKRLLCNLSAKTRSTEVEALAQLPEEDQARLKTLAVDLAEDPEQAAHQIRAHKDRLDGARKRLVELQRTVSDENTTTLDQAYKNYESARRSAALTSEELFSDEVLPAVGSDVWQSLWEAARKYSDERAYPRQKFPVVSEGARCVLCHQELSPEASNRLNRFEFFVLNEVKKREEDSRKALDCALSKMQAARIPMKGVRVIVSLTREELANEELANAIRRSAVVNAWRVRKICRAVRHKGATVQTPVVPAPESEMGALVQTLEKRATDLLAGKDSQERKALISEYEGLKARQWLDTVKADVLGQIDRRKNIDALKEAQAETETQKITNFATNLVKRLVTDKLRAGFAHEVKQLGGIAGQHQIELMPARTSKGVPLFHVRIANDPKIQVGKIGKILSEGEHRCAALAAFLAELSTLETLSGIVFDDPVSSLDHIHRDKVAKRLAEESMKRQVVIFTHDTAFLVLLEDACRKTETRQKIPIDYRIVSRGKDAAGFCKTESPASVRCFKEASARMRNQLKCVKGYHERGDQERWRDEVDKFSGQLRREWERAVEGVVSPVIRRLDRQVRTNGLIRLTVLDGQDCQKMREAYHRCSQFLHSQPAEINHRLPSPEDIEREINALEAWFKSIKTRQDKAHNP